MFVCAHVLINNNVRQWRDRKWLAIHHTVAVMGIPNRRLPFMQVTISDTI